MGTAVAQWLRSCATNLKVAGSIPAGVSEFFIDIKSFRSHYGPGFDSASNGNQEYHEYLLEVKAAVCKADNLPPSCAVVTLYSSSLSPSHYIKHNTASHNTGTVHVSLPASYQEADNFRCIIIRCRNICISGVM